MLMNGNLSSISGGKRTDKTHEHLGLSVIVSIPYHKSLHIDRSVEKNRNMRFLSTVLKMTKFPLKFLDGMFLAWYWFDESMPQLPDNTDADIRLIIMRLYNKKAAVILSTSDEVFYISCLSKEAGWQYERNGLETFDMDDSSWVRLYEPQRATSRNAIIYEKRFVLLLVSMQCTNQY